MLETQNSWLTTTDNPYDSFTQFDEWNKFDMANGYNTCAYIARIAKTSDEMSEEDYNIEVERAINEILKFDPINIYIKTKPKSVQNSLEQHI